jgi:hypothetical protein
MAIRSFEEAMSAQITRAALIMVAIFHSLVSFATAFQDVLPVVDRFPAFPKLPTRIQAPESV